MLKKKKNKKESFTLIEMLVVISMLALISLATYTVFSNGAKIWQRANKNTAAEDLNVFFDKFTSDLRNSFKFTGISFLGMEDRIEFATLVKSPRLQKTTIGKVIYYYNNQTKKVNREKNDFSQAYNNEEDEFRETISDVKSLKFQYYFYNSPTKEYLWIEEWLDADKLPLAVRLELELDSCGENNKFVKTVTIPTSG